MTILNLTYADPANYPPTINACRCQVAVGHKSYLAGYYRGIHRGFCAGEGIKEHYFNEPPGSFPTSLSRKILDLWGFRNQTASLILSCKPDIIIAYDYSGLWGVLPAIGKVPIIYHAHDMMTPGLEREMGGQIDIRMHQNSLRRVNEVAAVVMPEENRLEVARKAWGLVVPCFTVPNCACLTSPGRTSILPDLIEERTGCRPEYIVVRVGGAGAANLIEQTVLALQSLPDSVHLCLVGCGNEEYANRLARFAIQSGVGQRLHQFPYLNYDDMRSYLRSASVGLALYTTAGRNINHRFMGTASVKFMECLSMGIPIVALDSQSFRDLSERTGGVSLAEDERPESIASAVLRALSDRTEAQRRLMESHATTFNYEQCYAPLLAYLKGLPKR